MFKQIFFAYIQRLKRDDLSTYSAQIAFFSMLSLVPLMLILSLLMNSSGLLNLQGLVDLIIESAKLNAQTAQILRSLISGVNGSVTLFSFSTITIIWASSRMIRAIMKGIHMAYREQDNHSLVIRYLISILYTLLLCVVLFLAMVGFLYGHSILQLISSLGYESGLLDVLWNIGRFILPAGISFLVFWTMYRLIPSRKVTMRDCLPGAILSTLLVFLFSFIFSLMVKYTGDFSLLYGSLSNVIMILMWFLFFGYALLLGMELNGVLYEDAEYQLYMTQLRAKWKENSELRKAKKLEMKALRKEQKAQKKEDKARFREAARVLAAQMAEEEARKKSEEAAAALSAESSENADVSSSDEAAASESATAEDAPPSESATIEEAPASEPATVEDLPASESVTVDNAPTSEPATVEDAPASEPATVEEVPASESATVEDAPTSEPATVEEVPASEPATVEEVPASEPATVEDAPASEPATVEDAPASESATVEDAPAYESATVEEIPASESATEKETEPAVEEEMPAVVSEDASAAVSGTPDNSVTDEPDHTSKGRGRRRNRRKR